MLIVTVLLVASPVWAEQMDTAHEAQVLHEQGVNAFQQERYLDAIQAFEAAERMSHNPNNLWNIMSCFERLGNLDAALVSLERYLSSPDLAPQDRETAAQRRVELEAARRAAEAQPADAPAPAPEPEPVEPPEPAQPEPEPPPAAEPEPPIEQPVAEGPSLAGPWAVLGTGLALALTGVILDVAAYVRADPEGQDTFTSLDEVDDWRTGAYNIALAGDVLVGVGAATAVAGLIWLLVARNRHAPDQAAPIRMLAGREGLMVLSRIEL
jgi:tetratricopeptide (TPR) repeat protein